MESVRLDGGPPENAALALTRLAVIAARLASPPSRRRPATAPPRTS